MKLIDAEKVITELDKMGIAAQQRVEKETVPGKVDFGKGLMTGIAMASAYIQEKSTIAFEIDKVVEQLNNKFKKVSNDEDLEWNRAIDKAIEIVQNGGMEK